MGFSNKYCTNCVSSAICSVLSLIKQFPELDNAIGSCHYFRLTQKGTQSSVPPIDRGEVVKKLKEMQEAEVSAAADGVYLPEEKLFCHVCKKNNTELVECTKCGALICGECMTNTIDGEVLCPNCYQNLDESLPSNFGNF